MRAKNQAQLQLFLSQRARPTTREEYDALDPTEPFVLAYAQDEHYGPVVALSCKALFDNVFTEHQFWHDRNQQIFTLKADATFDYEKDGYVCLDFTTDAIVYDPKKGKSFVAPKLMFFQKRR